MITMGKFKFTETGIEGMFVVEPTVFEDNRGYFMETFQENDFKEAGHDLKFVQDNQSKSSYGVLRGLHFQKPPHCQSKLVRCIKGAVLDVAVDLRKGSPTYKQWVGVELSAENKRMLFIPRGFAHGFVVLSESVLFAYKCDNTYMPSHERGIAFNDPAIGIDWKVGLDKYLLSEKDSRNPLLADAELFDWNNREYLQ